MNPESKKGVKIGSPLTAMPAPGRCLSHSHLQASSPTFDARWRILEAASRLFGEKGYAATSITEIVEASEISRPTLYYYFGNKQGLYQALLDDRGTQIDQLLQHAGNLRGTPWAKVECRCQGLAILMERDVMMRRLIAAGHFGPSPDTPLHGALRLWQKIETGLWTLLIEGRQSGLLQYDQVEDALGLVKGLVLTSASGGHTTLSRMLKLALRGMGSGEPACDPRQADAGCLGPQATAYVHVDRTRLKGERS